MKNGCKSRDSPIVSTRLINRSFETSGNSTLSFKTIAFFGILQLEHEVSGLEI